jgi:two-component system OmpR family response regulator
MTTKGAPRILIVDDEPSIVDPLSARLRDAGFIVNEAGTGRRALALAQEDPPDLLVVDVMLRELDGIEIVRRLRADGMRAPVILGWPRYPLVEATTSPSRSL